MNKLQLIVSEIQLRIFASKRREMTANHISHFMESDDILAESFDYILKSNQIIAMHCRGLNIGKNKIWPNIFNIPRLANGQNDKEYNLSRVIRLSKN